MTILEFFKNDGVVRCESSEEDAAVIELCQQEGIPIYAKHDSYSPGHWWGLSMYNGFISGFKEGSSVWKDGTPYCDFLTICEIGVQLPTVDDFI